MNGGTYAWHQLDQAEGIDVGVVEPPVAAAYQP
jgi:hypothetical protein